ncbi:unnamed protein product [Paramecium sonneborni]|uniref:Transmembrane protein n=1 Tax=Paramecium sonneborni TaxID=65129 RepID=A0A8S1R9G1_9CILI|nr:unnamed protein product [Paramecium sonneborni]
MLIFVIYYLVQSLKEQEILIGYPQIIEYYSNAGIIIEQNLTSTSVIDLTTSPCQVVSQQLINQNMLEQSLPIIPQYLPEQFSQYFDDGHFIGLIPHIISFVNIDNDVIILTNQAELIYIRFLNETFIVSDKINLNINLTILQYPAFMEIITNQLIIIMYSDTVGITLDVKSTKIFSKSFRIYESFNTTKISSVAIVNNMIFIAMGIGGLKIFQLNGQILGSIDFLYSINNATDLKVFHQFDVYFIYLLDYDLGVTSFIYNPKSTLIYKNERLDTIPYSGDIIDIHNNIMMIASYQNQETIIHEIQLNYTDFSWKQVNTHIINQIIVDIDILDHIAITIGQNGNTVIFHSIPSQYQIKQQHFIMPSLLKLNFIKSKGSLYLIGVSLHNFYYSKLELKQSYLYCYFEFEQEIMLSYSQISKCKQSDTICNYTQEYIIKSIKPIITTEQNFQIYLILIFVVLAFIIIIIVLIRQFKKYNDFVHNLDSTCPKSNEITMQTYESPTKIIKFNQTGAHTSQFSIISNMNRLQQI